MRILSFVSIGFTLLGIGLILFLEEFVSSDPFLNGVHSLSDPLDFITISIIISIAINLITISVLINLYSIFMQKRFEKLEAKIFELSRDLEINSAILKRLENRIIPSSASSVKVNSAPPVEVESKAEVKEVKHEVEEIARDALSLWKW